MRIRAYGGTDVGLQRDHNEDSYFCDEELGIFAVADGVGGHSAGEVASKMAVETVAERARAIQHLLLEYRQRRDESSRQQLVRALPGLLEQANEEIFLTAQENPEMRGMATTAVLLLPMGTDAFVCHVGDSRVYLYRDRSLFQVTEDHSLVMSLFKKGMLTQKELATHPRKNIILRSLGHQATVEVDTLYLDVAPGDVFLLCSDGLSDMVPEEEISRLCGSWRGNELVRRLIDAANRHGGRDNVTVVVVEVEEDLEEAQTRQYQHFGVQQRVTFLQDIFLFTRLNDQECVKVNRILYERSYQPRELVVREGEQGDELFIVVTGKLGVWRGDVRLTTLGPGGHFGEMSLLADAPRSASVVAEEPCTLWVVQRGDLLELCQEDPALGNKILWAFLQNMADRVRDLTSRLAAMPIT